MIPERSWEAGLKPLFCKAIFLFCWLVLGFGCANRSPLPGELDFAARGKIGVRLADQGYSARFAWQQQGPRYDIQVWGPLGQGRTVLSGTKDYMAVRRGEKTLAQGAPESVMLTHLGWSMPVEVLPAWLAGKYHQDYPVSAQQRDEQGDLIAFTQAGWQVSLERYRLFDGNRAPARIVASRGDERVTVALQSLQPLEIIESAKSVFDRLRGYPDNIALAKSGGPSAGAISMAITPALNRFNWGVAKR